MSRMGSEVARLRKEIGMTQKQLAKLVGVTEGFINDVEAGRKILNGELSVKISKALRMEVSKLDLYEDEAVSKPMPEVNVKKVIEKPVQAVWNDALSGVLKAVPVYDYKMEKSIGTRQLPVIDNKIEGMSKDKVFYLSIENDDMSGFRISKGDMALAFNTQELEKDAIYLVEHEGKKCVRQIKSVGGDKLLLVSNSGKLSTDMAGKKEIKIIARLVRLEITL